MSNTTLSRRLSRTKDKSLSGWDRAIAEAKKRIREIKRSITRFESLKFQGMEFPELRTVKPRRGRTSESAKVTYGSTKTFGAKPGLAASRLCLISRVARGLFGQMGYFLGKPRHYQRILMNCAGRRYFLIRQHAVGSNFLK